MALLGQEQKIEDYTTIEPEVQQPSGREMLLSLYSEKPPKPKFDTTTPSYLQRAAKLNALGRGLSTLGDVFSLSKGGNVNRPTPDTKTGAYVNNYFKYLDDYRDKVDKYNLIDFQNKMSIGRALAGQANTDRAYDASENRLDKTMAYRKGRDEKTDERYQKEFDFKNRQYEEQPERQKELYRFQVELQKAKQKNDLQNWIAKESLKLQFDKEKNKYILYDNTGKPGAAVDDEGQIQKLYHVITSDPKMKEESDAMMEILKAELGEGVSLGHMKIIVSKLWDRSDAAKQWLGLNEQQQGYQVPSMWQNNSQSAPQSTPAPNARNQSNDVKSKWGSYAR